MALKGLTGQPLGFLSVGLDVTERARADDVIRESEERYRRLVEMSQDGISILRDGLVVYANEAMTRMLKALTSTEVIGVPWLDFMVVGERAALSKRLESLVTPGSSLPYTEQRLLCLDGLALEVELAASAVLVDGHIYLQVQTRDISARKWTEREILRLNAELERRVDERTAELQRANEQLESFSYSVAHDLRAPLRAMSGFSAILLEDFGPKLDPIALGYLNRITSSADRMSELIDDLLMFAQVARTELTRSRVPFEALARQVCADLGQNYPSTQLVVGPMPDAYGDANLLRQVLSNLVGNALKFSAKRDQPRVELGFGMSPKGSFGFFVRDNGVGFNPDYASKLFGVFQRLHSTQEFEGTGVGLAIVHRIIHRHGGEIWADSQLDHGATFWFTLDHDMQLEEPVSSKSISFAV